LTLGGSLDWTGWDIFMRYVLKTQKLNNLSKTGSFVKIFQREPTKIINSVKIVVKNRRFWVIFSTKTRYCTLNSLDRGTKVGFKMKYNCYMLPIQVLKNLFGLGGEIWGSEHWILRNLKKLNW
jgi:hypothetical protein